MQIQYRTQLVELLKHYNLPLTGIELGVAEGFNSKDLLEAGIEQLYMIDSWEYIDQRGDANNPQEWHNQNYIDAYERVKRFEGKATLIKGRTGDVAPHIKDNYFGLVYIDAAHDYENVKNDIHNYYPKLVEGGIMAFHDFVDNGYYGVKRAVYEFAMENNLEVNIIPENKEEDRGAWFVKK